MQPQSEYEPTTPHTQPESLGTYATHEEQRRPSTPPEVISCSCMDNTLRIVQRLDDDEFHLTTLPLDQVLHLQKWLIFQCCKPLDCTSCTSVLATHTVVLVICERLSEMFECIDKRIRRGSAIMTGEQNEWSPGSASTDDPSASLESTPAQLFDGSTGGASRNSICNPMMFSGEIREQYSEEEQIHLIRVLLRCQIRNFRQFLVRVGDLDRPPCNDARRAIVTCSNARRAKVIAMVTRLEEASAAIDTALRMVLRSFASA